MFRTHSCQASVRAAPVRPRYDRRQVFETGAPRVATTAVILPLRWIVDGRHRQVLDPQQVDVRCLRPGAVVPNCSVTAGSDKVVCTVWGVFVIPAEIDPCWKHDLELKRGGRTRPGLAEQIIAAVDGRRYHPCFTAIRGVLEAHEGSSDAPRVAAARLWANPPSDVGAVVFRVCALVEYAVEVSASDGVSAGKFSADASRCRDGT